MRSNTISYGLLPPSSNAGTGKPESTTSAEMNKTPVLSSVEANKVIPKPALPTRGLATAVHYNTHQENHSTPVGPSGNETKIKPEAVDNPMPITHEEWDECKKYI